MCDHKKKKELCLARSNINTSIQGELSDTMPLMWQKERKEVEHIESKSRTRDDRLLVTILLVLQICELFGGIVPLMIEV